MTAFGKGALVGARENEEEPADCGVAGAHGELRDAEQEGERQRHEDDEEREGDRDPVIGGRRDREDHAGQDGSGGGHEDEEQLALSEEEHEPRQDAGQEENEREAVEEREVAEVVAAVPADAVLDERPERA